MQEAYAHCERLVRAADKDRFLAALFAPAALRPHLFALYAFNVEIARIADIVSGPMPGEIRLQWWREAIAGERGAEAAANPVASALRATVGERDLPADLLTGMIEARAFDLYDDPMPTWRALEGYAERTASALFTLAARILQTTENPAARELALHGGIADGLTKVLAAFPHQARRSRLYLPMEVLVAHGARPEDIFAGTATAGLKAALEDVGTRARDHFARAREASVDLVSEIRPAFLPLTLTRALLDRLNIEDPFDPVEIPQWRRQWILWRAARIDLSGWL